jgi:flagellar biosynthesis protein FlhG
MTMNSKDRSKKVIPLPGRASDRRKALVEKRGRGTENTTRVMAITSGKGGVGKTNIVANLGYAFCMLGKRVLVLDADLGLGNLDVLLGLTPRYNLSHVITGEKGIGEVVVKGPGRMQILPATSGIQELTELDERQKDRIVTELEAFLGGVDILLIDTAAGISSNVMYFNVCAQEIMVIVTPEPTSMTDAYALMKVLSVKYSERKFKLIVNMVGDAQEAYEVFRQLNMVTDRFLDISIDYVGHILMDKNVTRGVRRQKVVAELYPDTPASMCFAALAKKIDGAPPPKGAKGDTRMLLNNLLRNESD